MRWSEQDLTDHLTRNGQPRPINPRAKFKNIRTEVGGKKFDSKLEATRYQELEQLEALKVIRDLRAQVQFPLMVGEHYIGCYVADAVYFDAKTGRKIVEDSKGVPTPLFRWKAKHFRAQYGFDITIHTKRKTT